MRVVESDPNADLADWMTKAMGIGFLLWLALTGFYLSTRQNKVLWRGTVDAEGVSVPDIKVNSMEPISTIEIQATADSMRNNWVYLHCAFVNVKTEAASHMGVNLEFWAGSGWKEGKKKKTEIFTGIPNGNYTLQIYPDAKSTYKGSTRVKIRRDVRMWRYPICTFFLVFLVPLLVIMQNNSGGDWSGGGGGGFVAAGGGCGSCDGGCGSCDS